MEDDAAADKKKSEDDKAVGEQNKSLDSLKKRILPVEPEPVVQNTDTAAEEARNAAAAKEKAEAEAEAKEKAAAATKIQALSRGAQARKKAADTQRLEALFGTIYDGDMVVLELGEEEKDKGESSGGGPSIRHQSPGVKVKKSKKPKKIKKSRKSKKTKPLSGKGKKTRKNVHRIT